MFDLLIRNGRVVDGTGLPWVRADIGVTGDRVIAVGQIGKAEAKQTIDATGKIVCPGFVDTHVHGDLPLIVDPYHEPAVRQGVTTYIVGQDGVAFAPASPETMRYMKRYTAGFNGNFPTPGKDWRTVAEYLDVIDRKAAINAATLIPNGNVRMEVMGLEDRPPTVDELARMRRLVREGMEQGAVGLSSGLDYVPSIYADVHELTALCEEIAPFGGVYVTHMRGYTPQRFGPAIEEVFAIGRGAGCGVHVSHFNVIADHALPVVDAARADGVDVTYDLYCYLYGNTIVAMVTLPPEYCAGGIEATVARLRDPAVRRDLEAAFATPRFPINTIRLANVPHPDWKHYEGMLLSDAVKAHTGGTSVRQTVDFVCDLLVTTDLAAGCVLRHFAERQESDTRALMRHPAMMAGSDGIYCGGAPHPRGTGCFARYLGEYVRNGTWTIETAVRHLAYHGARRHGLTDRGLLAAGYAADVVVFDPDTIADRSTFENGKALAVGVEHVAVNGELVLHNGERTKALPGRGLRKKN
ncbi:N-acyl-D-amino-acid deacylase family protein [Fimbriiglobus ruber]|uniref:N-acyl-D-amino-acid deacylase n=1 Tax=Fimbriiglobus ruber TaxID=1908690 RepID=A0A225D7Q2_9BACT|nr:D-aminoacylase [Fimbriiglobus ruber]OWK37630.1 N-acyl-D-amino-acid deacylase [Fimbriiglobus ruber]